MESGTNQSAVQHAILLGQYPLTIDDANRILIPAEIRKALQAYRATEYLYVNIDPTSGKPAIYPPYVFESFVQRIQPAMVADSEELDFLLSYFGSSAKTEIDKQGRILVPELILEETKVGKAVMLVGAGQILTVWNREEWNAGREARRKKISTSAVARWKQLMMPPAPAPNK